MTAIIFIIVLAVLIFVHEFGHFLLARAFGIRVDAFKIGFGPKLFAWKRGETEYGVNMIPFGGFVKIHGENPDEDSTSGSDSSRSFVNKNRWKQASVLAAGVFMNFLFAWFLYVCVFASGVTASTTGFEKYAQYFDHKEIMVTSVAKDSPAEKAGLKEGDVINYVETTPMNGAHAKAGVSLADKANSQTIPEIQETVNSASDMPVAIEYVRDGKSLVIGVVPVTGIVAGKNAIGIGMDNVGHLKLPLFTAIGEGFRYTLVLIKETFIGLYTFIANIFGGTPNFSDVAGPVGIAGIVGNAARLGFTYLLMITALISINLGVVNLIPFPALDGGRILFVALEGISRRRISPRFTNAVNAVGFIALMALMVIVTWKDIAKLWK